MWGQYFILIIFSGLQFSNTKVRRIWDSSFSAPGRFQVWSSKLIRKFGRQKSCQLFLEHKCQSNIFVLFACHLLQRRCGQGDPSPSYFCGICSLNYLFILDGCCQWMLLNQNQGQNPSCSQTWSWWYGQRKAPAVLSYKILEIAKRWSSLRKQKPFGQNNFWHWGRVFWDTCFKVKHSAWLHLQLGCEVKIWSGFLWQKESVEKFSQYESLTLLIKSINLLQR